MKTSVAVTFTVLIILFGVAVNVGIAALVAYILASVFGLPFVQMWALMVLLVALFAPSRVQTK